MAPLDAEQLRAPFEPVPAMIWRADLDGKVDYVNSAWLAFTGQSLDDSVGLQFLDCAHPADASSFLARFREQFERREVFEAQLRMRRFDGAYRRIASRAAPHTDATGAFAGFIGSCLDIEDHLVASSQSGADDFFDSALDNLCVAGLDGYFKRVSPSWMKTLGWSARELMSKPSIELVHPDDREMTLGGRERLRQGRPMGPLVNRYLCKDGTYRWFEWRSTSRDGLVYASARDVTEQKHTEQQLAESARREEQMQRQLVFADRMASVGTLAAGVAHEINNPLAAVTTNIALILEELAAASGASSPAQIAELNELATDVRSGAERIRKIVRALKTFSRAEEERRTVIEVVPLLEATVEMAFNEIRHRARLVWELGPIPRVEADEARLGQVIVNLLVNAAQALPEGHSVSNEIRIVTSTDSAGRAVIEVRDTGEGIPPDLIERIFDPFFTTKPIGVGTGLGLSICHTIVTDIGGSLAVESRQGSGTTFRVVLPPALVIEAAPPPPSTAITTTTRAAVLVVDDERAIGVALCRALRDHDVTALTSAREALELLKTGKHFDIILSDLMMPEMSGMDFHDELSRRFPAAAERVVFISGGTFSPGANAFLARVGAPVIEKPFDTGVVRAVVEQSVGRAP